MLESVVPAVPATRMAALQMLAIARYRCALRLALHAAGASFTPDSSIAAH
jgi:hypothetical protein